MHPGALYLLGAVYLTGDCLKKDIASALWCFHRASEKVKLFLMLDISQLLLDVVKLCLIHYVLTCPDPCHALVGACHGVALPCVIHLFGHASLTAALPKHGAYLVQNVKEF